MGYHLKSRRMVYGLTLFFIALTGFAQMPIFKRYYIADIPGLGWLAQFYVTHAIHYALAALLMGFCAYVALDYFFARRHGSTTKFKMTENTKISASAQVKIAALCGLIITGIFMVVKNLSGVYFSHGMVIGLDLLHLLFCMVLLGATAYTWVRRRTWIL
ncbi:MAG TPA: hypothetical protein VJ943_01880 [Desulfotignum sp.]|nr:hypothetical protein [Desulfotignum sp.]